MDFLRLNSCKKGNISELGVRISCPRTGPLLGQTAGFSMVETLVAIVIMAVGVIGAAGMQLTALRTARQSAYQSTASHIASDMAEAIRAGQAWASRGGRPDPYLEFNHDASNADGSAPAGISCYTDVCEPAEFAAFEISEWRTRINQSLPGGRFVICRDSEPWDGGSNSVAWQCRDDGDGMSPAVVKLGWRVTHPDANLAADANHSEEIGIAIIVNPGA